MEKFALNKYKSISSLFFALITLSGLLGSGLGAVAVAPDPDQNLLNAARAGDLKGVKQALSAGVNRDEKYEGLTVLDRALAYAWIEGESPKIVMYLIIAGANANAVINGKTILHIITCLDYADGKDTLEVVRLLIAKGVDVNIQDDDGCTPLIYAAENGRADIVKLLLQNGADAGIIGPKGDALLAACVWDNFPYENSFEVIKLLIEAGADPNSLDSDGYPPLYHVALYGDMEMVELLLRHTSYENRMLVIRQLQEEEEAARAQLLEGWAPQWIPQTHPTFSPQAHNQIRTWLLIARRLEGMTLPRSIRLFITGYIGSLPYRAAPIAPYYCPPPEDMQSNSGEVQERAAKRVKTQEDENNVPVFPEPPIDLGIAQRFALYGFEGMDFESANPFAQEEPQRRRDPRYDDPNWKGKEEEDEEDFGPVE